MMNITRKKAVQLMLAATCAWLATGCMQEEWERPEQKVKTTICADIPSEDEDVHQSDGRPDKLQTVLE